MSQVTRLTSDCDCRRLRPCLRARRKEDTWFRQDHGQLPGPGTPHCGPLGPRGEGRAGERTCPQPPPTMTMWCLEKPSGSSVI